MRGLWNILSLYRNEFDKFNTAEARMLDSACQRTLNYFEIIFWRKMLRFCNYVRNVVMGGITYHS